MPKQERNEQILLDIVEEYIKTAEPVSSQELLKKYKYSLSSATLRNIMAELDEAGFLFQPHTSAGRIPTQKAYRFFVDKVALGSRKMPDKKEEEKQVSPKFKKELREAMQESPDAAARMLSHYLAEMTNTIAFAGLLSINHFYKEGLSNALREPEFLSAENIRSLVNYADSLEGRLDQLYKSIRNDISVYIGDFADPKYESPFSLMAFTSELPARRSLGEGGPHNEKGVFGILGPMRMHYSENLELLNDIRKLFEE